MNKLQLVGVVCFSLLVVAKIVKADDIIKETSASGYEVVTLVLKRHPSMKKLIEGAMSDNTVTESEYNNIRSVDESLNREAAKKELRAAIDVAP